MHVFQFYPIEDVLRKYDKGSINGAMLIEKLMGSTKPERMERIFLVKVLGKYLMKNAIK